MISGTHNIALTEIGEVLLALVAFFPVAVCPGYLISWFVDLHGFRSRSLVERMLWSIPASLALSAIASFLIAWAFSVNAVVGAFLASAILWLALLVWDWRQQRRIGCRLPVGFKPRGRSALILAAIWITVAILSLVDFEYNHQLFSSITIYDQGARVNWTDSILRTGVPPANPYYWYLHAAPMRNYYFWYILCAAVVRMAHVSARTALMASCIWSGFGLAALIGLYLKHFLRLGRSLRRQFIIALTLLMVCGLDIIVHIWNLIFEHIPPFSHPRAWFIGQIDSWFVSLLFAPHHVAALVCCMFAFLLAWIAGNGGSERVIPMMVLITLALASAFGLSLYVTFAFTLLMLSWGLWQLMSRRNLRSSLMLAVGGLCAGLLLIPYLRQLTASSLSPSTGIRGSASAIYGSAPFGFSIRETVPPDRLLATGLFHSIALSHPEVARSLAKLLLLVPGLTVELGFFLVALIFYLVPSFRNHTRLAPAQRTLVFISAASVIITSFIRSYVISYNDFGFRGALFAQFCLLLLGTEVVMLWQDRGSKQKSAEDRPGVPVAAPSWLLSIAAFACVFGGMSTVYYALGFRVTVPLAEWAQRRLVHVHDPIAGNFSHESYILHNGYAQLDTAVPRSAIVQFNPSLPSEFWRLANLVAINRQVAIAWEGPWCGAEMGGDPTGCHMMGPPIAGLFKDASDEQARSTCRQFGIQYLVATIYDPVWNDKQSWVWALPPVVQDSEFRALDCR